MADFVHFTDSETEAAATSNAARAAMPGGTEESGEIKQFSRHSALFYTRIA